MGNGVIRLGDKTTQGCTVIKVGAGHFTALERPVARVGDLCRCAQPGADTCMIIEGAVGHTINGVPVAYHGHKTSCGERLISTATVFAFG